MHHCIYCFIRITHSACKYVIWKLNLKAISCIDALLYIILLKYHRNSIWPNKHKFIQITGRLIHDFLYNDWGPYDFLQHGASAESVQFICILHNTAIRIFLHCWATQNLKDKVWAYSNFWQSNWFYKNIFSFQSEGLASAIYSSNWINQSRRIRTNALFVLQRCQNPVVVKVEGFFSALSFETCVSVSSIEAILLIYGGHSISVRLINSNTKVCLSYICSTFTYFTQCLWHYVLYWNPKTCWKTAWIAKKCKNKCHYSSNVVYIFIFHYVIDNRMNKNAF